MFNNSNNNSFPINQTKSNISQVSNRSITNKTTHLMKKKPMNSSANLTKKVIVNNQSNIININHSNNTNVSVVKYNHTNNNSLNITKRVLTSNSSIIHSKNLSNNTILNNTINHTENYSMNISVKKSNRRENEKLFRKDEKSKLFLQHKKIKALSSIEDEIKKISSNSGFKNCLELDKFNFKSFIEVFAVIVMISIVILLFNYFTDYSVKSKFI